MKKIVFSVFLLVIYGNIFSQVNNSNSPVTYTVILNNVPGDFNYPLIGIVNNASGNHKSVQLGVINSTAGTFKGCQAGVVNTILNDFHGIHGGLINSVGNNAYGIECGFINTTKNEFIGIQSGFINSVTEFKGIQDGVINNTKNNLIGIQNGFINTVGGQTIGLQNGFINSTKCLTGLQLGFINSVDTLEAGVPIGFLSFVKHGGFSALELGTNESFRFTLSYKIGTKLFYSFPVLSLSSYKSDGIGVGFGFGSNLQLANKLVFNPELSTTYSILNNPYELTTFNTSLGIELIKGFDIIAGPSFTWKRPIIRSERNNHENWVFNHNFNLINDFALGFKCAIRYTL